MESQEHAGPCQEYLRGLDAELLSIQTQAREGADRMQTYLNVAEVILVVLDAQQRVVMINRKGRETLGLTEAEILGKNWFDSFVPEKDREPARTVFTLLMNGEERAAGQYEHPVLSALGEERLVAWHNKTLQDQAGLPSGVLSSGQDITERKQAERDRDLLAHAVEQAGEAIIITDSRGIIQYVNPAFERITGFANKEAIGNNPRILKSGMHGKEFYDRLWRTIESGQVWRGRMINRRKDGVLYEQDSAISPMIDAAGRISNYVEVQRDVTAQVEMESRLRQAAKMEAVGRLAGGIAHDFNNQLTVIKGFCELMLGELPEDSPLREPVTEIHRAAQRSATMTSQLLAFSRKQMLRPVVVGINLAIQEMAKTLGRMLGERTRLNLHLAETVGNIEVDPGQLQQAVMNLALNARDAMPDGGTLTIETADVELTEEHIGADRDVPAGPYVMLAISDTGLGMDAATLRHIFEPFFTTKGVGEGTGLGLSMVHGFVKQSGGRISVYSAPGRGTTFRIYLPRMLNDVLPTAEIEEAEPRLGGSETILVVEDEEAVRNLIVRLLGERGWQVLSAGNAVDAMMLSEKHPGRIHLLISDVVMPGMEGPELARQIRQSRPDVKVLYITGYAEHAALGQGLKEQEGVALLTKPFSPSALSRKIRSLLYAEAPAGMGGTV